MRFPRSLVSSSVHSPPSANTFKNNKKLSKMTTETKQQQEELINHFYLLFLNRTNQSLLPLVSQQLRHTDLKSSETHTKKKKKKTNLDCNAGTTDHTQWSTWYHVLCASVHSTVRSMHCIVPIRVRTLAWMIFSRSFQHILAAFSVAWECFSSF